MSSIWQDHFDRKPEDPSGIVPPRPTACPPVPAPIILEHAIPTRADPPSASRTSAPARQVDAVLAERGERYGHFGDVACTAQSLKNLMRTSPGWTRLSASQREGLDMIQCKIARMLHGDPSYLDNIVDICGYAELVHAAMRSAAPGAASVK